MCFPVDALRVLYSVLHSFFSVVDLSSTNTDHIDPTVCYIKMYLRFHMV
jgi:hypothetical protein